MKHLIRLVAILLLTAPLTAANEELPVLWLEAGKKNEFQTIYLGPATDWSLRFEHRTLDGGKMPGQTPLAQAIGHQCFFIKTPPLKSGTVILAMLYFGQSPYRRVVIASPDPLEDRENWFRQHPIVLYDPEKKTAELFDREKIPFKHLGSFAEIEATANMVIVIGQETDFERERGLAELLFKKSIQGGAVLVAAPKGNIPLDYHPSVHSLNLRVDARSVFPLTSGRRGGGNWVLRAQGNRLVLATEFIPPYGTDGGKVMGVGPTVLDIRFSDNNAIDFEIKPRGRIIFDKELYFSRMEIGGPHVETAWYLRSLLEELSREFNPKGN